MSDAAGNALVAPFTTGEAYTLDRTAPVVSSITRAAGAANPTNGGTVQFVVSFSEGVTGVDVADFAVDASGVTGASVTGVSGSGSTYTVTVSTGTGDGTLSIDLGGSPTVSDAAGNALVASFTAGETYTLDRTAPVVSSIVRMNPSASLTNASVVAWRVTFSESLDSASLGAGDFSLAVLSGIVSGTVSTITPVSGGNNQAFDVTLTGVTGDGEARLELAGQVSDPAGNIQAGGFVSGQSFVIDQSAPQVVSLNRQVPGGEFTNNSVVTYRLTWNEAVNPSTVTTSDFSIVVLSGSVSGQVSSVVSVAGGGDKVFDIVVSNITGAGSFRLAFTGSASDVPGNIQASPFSAGQPYQIDRTPPSVVSITRVGPASTYNSSVDFVALFSEPMDPATLDAQDFLLSSNGTASGVISAILPVQGNPSAFTVRLTGLAGAGMVRPDIGSGASIGDLAGNTFSGSYRQGDSVTLAPVLVRLSSSSALGGAATPARRSASLSSISSR